MTSTDFAQQRTHWVDSQVRPNDVTDHRLIHALSEIPREAFLPVEKRALAYMEGCIPLGDSRVLPDARSFAKLAQLAAVAENDTVLDVGCGCGYSTAVLARLAKHVTGLESDPGLAAKAESMVSAPNAKIVRGSLKAGVPGGSFDVVFVNGAVEDEPKFLLDQLAEGGRLVCIRRDGGVGRAMLYVRSGGAIGARTAFDAQLPVLPGFERAPQFVF